MITSYKLFLESIEPLIYDKDSKSMVGVYKVLDTNENTTTLENVQELQKHTGMEPVSGVDGIGNKVSYMDGTLAAYRITRVIKTIGEGTYH